ncbi:MAG: alpha/beta hydrolase [Oscillospiraceae bacterium]|nr:alpha/beta hydrolase [Oscillospiraceae bacterium]
MERFLNVPCGELQVPCKIYEPGYGEITRVVIGVHGFGGDKDSSVIAAIGEEMGFYKTATVSFDFPGHGDSPMPARTLNLKSATDSLMTAVELARRIFPRAEEWCVFATSYGAYVTLLAMDELKEKLGHIKLALRAPAVRMAETFLTMARLSEEQFLKKGRVVCGYDRMMEVPYSFYEELATHNAMANYDMPMMILQGDRDDIVLPHDVEFFRLLNEQSKLVLFPGTDHRFKGEGELDMIVDLARDWFLCEDVLLSEWQ